MENKKNIKKSSNTAISYLPVDGAKTPIKFVGNEYIMDTLEEGCIQQAVNTRLAPGVEDVVVNPDAHAGYGAPIGCVVKTSKIIYPGPVGFDIKCSMSLLQTDVPEKELKEKRVRRAIINAVEERVPTGIGQRKAPKAREVEKGVAHKVLTEGGSEWVCEKLGIPSNWSDRCEDKCHGMFLEVWQHLSKLQKNENFYRLLMGKFDQLGSYGGGNHFLSGDITRVIDEDVANSFGLKDGCLSLLSHCGSRGFGYQLAKYQFQALEDHFNKWNIPFPAGDKQLVYAPVDSPEGQEYLNDMYLGANFATVNHLLINALVLEAVQEIFPGASGELVYFISHNIAREEVIDGKKCWIHRKGATRAYPAKHFSLKDTPFYETGHPILLPGNVSDGSVVMVAQEGAKESLYSVNHGAGRCKGRRQAFRELDQEKVNKEIDGTDIITNCRNYPVDESKGVYKNFTEVTDSVEQANLAKRVAKLEPRFVLKDNDKK